MQRKTKQIKSAEVRDYIQYLREHGRRETTLHNYGLNLDHVFDVLAEGGKHTSVYDMDADDVAYLYVHLNLKECTIRDYIRLLSGMVIHYTGRDPGRQADILWNNSNDDVRRLFITLDQFKIAYHAADPTERMILVLGAYMGLRRMEIAGIRDSDITERGTMIVHGKGHGPQGKVCEMAIPEPVKREIAAYRMYKAGYKRKDDYLVQNVGPRKHGKRIDPTSLGNKVHFLSQRVGIPFSTHSLRRLYATTLYYECDVKLEVIKNLMRHAKSTSVIDLYIAPSKRLEQAAQASVGAVLDAAVGQI